MAILTKPKNTNKQKTESKRKVPHRKLRDICYIKIKRNKIVEHGKLKIHRRNGGKLKKNWKPKLDIAFTFSPESQREEKTEKQLPHNFDVTAFEKIFKKRGNI